ncbi:hypothetical protein CRUP_008248 [Coryphaenoides rupestris]|nr:hypothetical protein CRUP_008248 [Coryphaenoides rupestris]
MPFSGRPRQQQPGGVLKNQVWTGVFSITLVEGLDLPQHGTGDLYVRFRLADQKYKSKNLCIQANPQWRQSFDFNQFEDNQEPLQLYTNVLDQGKGRLVFLVTCCPAGVSVGELSRRTPAAIRQAQTIAEKLSLMKSHTSLREWASCRSGIKALGPPSRTV